MDSGKAVAPEVTVAAPGASPGYHVAPRTEILESAMQQIASPMMNASAISERKKRGRPRKYKPDESSSRVFPSMPSSSSAPPATGKSYAEEGKNKNKNKNKIGADKLDELVDCATGSSFAPHVLTINAGEDISSKIMEFSLQGPRSVCVISGSGTVSNVTIRHPDPSGGTLRYEGLFEILSFNGSFTPVDMPESRFGRSGMLSITLSGTDGRVIGGVISGVTIAASPVKVTIVSFLQGNTPQELKPKKQKTGSTLVADVSGPNASPQPDNSIQGGPSYSMSQNPTNWAVAQSAERPRKATTDINISLQG